VFATVIGEGLDLEAQGAERRGAEQTDREEHTEQYKRQIAAVRADVAASVDEILMAQEEA
jgi:hypothetical protein